MSFASWAPAPIKMQCQLPSHFTYYALRAKARIINQSGMCNRYVLKNLHHQGVFGYPQHPALLTPLHAPNPNKLRSFATASTKEVYIYV